MSILSTLARRIRLVIGRGVVRLVNDAGGLQRVQVELYRGELRELDRVQDYGMTSVPLPGAEVVTGSVGGSRNHSVVICIDDRRYRLKGLKPGEVALYTDEGDTIHFKRGRIIEINAGAEVIVNTAHATVNAPATINGDTVINGLTTINGGLQVNGTITSTQAIHSAVSLSAPVVMAVTSLTVNGIEVLGHKHPYGSSNMTGDML